MLLKTLGGQCIYNITISREHDTGYTFRARAIKLPDLTTKNIKNDGNTNSRNHK